MTMYANWVADNGLTVGSDSITKVSDSAIVNERAYTIEGTEGDCSISFTLGDVSKAVYVGLISDPQNATGLADIDFNIQTSATALFVREGSTFKNTENATITTSSVIGIEHDSVANEVNFKLDNVTFYTLPVTDGITFHSYFGMFLESDIGASVNDILFINGVGDNIGNPYVDYTDGLLNVDGTISKVGGIDYAETIKSSDWYYENIETELIADTVGQIRFGVTYDPDQSIKDFYFDLDNGNAKIFSQGAEVLDLGAFVNGTEFRVAYLNGDNRVHFYKDDIQVHVITKAEFHPLKIVSRVGSTGSEFDSFIAKPVYVIAPKNPVINTANYTFSFDINPLYDITQHKFTIDNEVTWNPCTSNLITVPTAFLKPKYVKVRVDVADSLMLECASAYPNPLPVFTNTISAVELIGQSNAQGIDPTNGTPVSTGYAKVYQDDLVEDWNDNSSIKQTMLSGFLALNEAGEFTDKYCVSQSAFGGSPLGVAPTTLPTTTWYNYSPTGTHRESASQNFKNMVMALENDGFEIISKYVVNIQGEADGDWIYQSAAGFSRSAYKTQLIELKDYLKSELTIDAFYDCEIGTTITGLAETGYSEIRLAKADADVEDVDITVFSTRAKDFVSLDLMYDNAHWKTEGQNLVGQDFSRVLKVAAPVIPEGGENNDTNTITLTPATGLEVRLKLGDWEPTTSPYTVTYETVQVYEIGEIQFRVKEEGINPASDVTANTIKFTAATQIDRTPIFVYANDLNIPTENVSLNIKLVNPVVIYKDSLMYSENVPASPDSNGKILFSLPDTDSMTTDEYYVVDAGRGVRFKMQVNKSTEEVNLINLPNFQRI